MAYTTVNKSSSFQNQVLYTGNSSARTISGVGFQPDFTWIKVRDGATAHFLFGMFSSQSVGMFWGILGTNDDQITEMNE